MIMNNDNMTLDKYTVKGKVHNFSSVVFELLKY